MPDDRPGQPLSARSAALASAAGLEGAPVTAPDDPRAVPVARPSLRGNTIARLSSEMVILVATLVTATLTARYLGPAGKGYYSSLMLLAGVVVLMFNAGLGEAAIVLSGRGRFTLDAAAAATLGAVLGLALVAGAALVGVASAVLPAETDNARLAIAFTAALVALNVVYTTTLSLLLARERVVAVGVLGIATAVLGTAGVWLLLAVADFGIAGAILGSTIAVAVVIGACVVSLPGPAISPPPRRVPGYLRAAIRYGVPLQLSNMLVLMTGRLDLLIVYHLQDPSAAGRYSIALTVGTLVASASMALSFAAFPRLANVGEAQARALTRQVVRTGIAAAVLSAIVLAAITPVAVPLAFGDDFADAVGPTLVLIPAGVLWSAQWLLARAAAARGVPRPLFTSFAVSFVCMVGLDLVLVGPHGEMGAACASLIASGVGMSIAAAHYLRRGWTARELLPGPGEFASIARAARAAAGGSP